MKRKKYLILVTILLVTMLFCAFAGCEQTTGDGPTTEEGGQESDCNHVSLTHHDAAEATCTEDGSIEYWTCEECGKYFLDAEGKSEITVQQTIIGAKGHSFNHIAALAPTCSEKGHIEYWTCEECGKYFLDAEGKSEITVQQTIIGAKGHSFNHIAALAPTCSEKGHIEYWQCLVCGKYYADEEASSEITIEDTQLAAGHTFEDGFCTVCGVSRPTQGLVYQLNSDGKSYSVVGIGTATDKDIVIADIYEGLPVTKIGTQAFNNTSITSIKIPESVKEIEDAFKDCNSLTDVYYAGDIEGWCNISFKMVGDSTPNPMYYAENFYINGELLQGELVIPNSVTSIRNFAFAYCTGLTSIILPDGVTDIGNYAFSYCFSLTSLVISDSVTDIGDYAFFACTSLTSIEIPDSVTGIGNYAFAFCSSATNLTIGDSVTTIGEYAYGSCTSLTSIVIPDSVTSIGELAFDSCESLTSLIIGNSVTSIGVAAFNYCTSLTSIVIPDSVTSMGERAFYSCTALTSVSIGNSLTDLGTAVFYQCTSLTNVIIGNSVTSIGEFAFSECINLTSIVIPDSVTSIDSAFSGCSGLTSITIPDSVTFIGYGAFWNCNNLTIYCEAASQPSGWDIDWNLGNRPVEWGYTG